MSSHAHTTDPRLAGYNPARDPELGCELCLPPAREEASQRPARDPRSFARKQLGWVVRVWDDDPADWASYAFVTIGEARDFVRGFTDMVPDAHYSLKQGVIRIEEDR